MLAEEHPVFPDEQDAAAALLCALLLRGDAYRTVQALCSSCSGLWFATIGVARIITRCVNFFGPVSGQYAPSVSTSSSVGARSQRVANAASVALIHQRLEVRGKRM
jgi:hypothetical protein